jgi:hypothetical protein
MDVIQVDSGGDERLDFLAGDKKDPDKRRIVYRVDQRPPVCLTLLLALQVGTYAREIRSIQP